jgi:two-component system response regulator NreC
MSAHLHLAPLPLEAATPVIRLVLGDDHASVRRSLRLLLGNEPGVRVVAEAADLKAAERELRTSSPTVLVLDLHIHGGPGIETIRRLRAQAPETEIVVVTMEPSPVFAQQALDAGAAAFVLKDRADTELPEAIRAAAGGLEYVSPHVAARLDALRRAVGDGLAREVT